MRLKSEEKSQQLTASHNNKEREAERALEKRDRVGGAIGGQNDFYDCSTKKRGCDCWSAQTRFYAPSMMMNTTLHLSLLLSSSSKTPCE
jgi:hypothetical protein